MMLCSNCLAATPLFGPLALNLFLEKMQAASEKAKVRCCARPRDQFAHAAPPLTEANAASSDCLLPNIWSSRVGRVGWTFLGST